MQLTDMSLRDVENLYLCNASFSVFLQVNDSWHAIGYKYIGVRRRETENTNSISRANAHTKHFWKLPVGKPTLYGSVVSYTMFRLRCTSPKVERAKVSGEENDLI